MILTVTPNSALDVTYTVPSLRPDAVHRVGEMWHRAGGKGINVGRVLHTLGEDVHLIATAGGPAGARFAEDLLAAGLSAELVPIASETRRTTTILSTVDSSVTLLNEPGPKLKPAEWAALVETVREAVGRASVLVCSGSLPPGAPPDGYAQLLALADGIPTILDASGDAFRAGLPGRPTAVKPNAEELREVTGLADPLVGAAELRRLGAAAVLVSLGADGLLASTSDSDWQARPSAVLTGNTTGAGDAAVAGIALELARGGSWPDVLRRAVALSGAAVLGPLAGDIDLDHYHRERPAVELLPRSRSR
ncbi:1-phosphofructokinase family hexose kinase [Amycolatopsis sp. H20-H5]|uniref:1-phosphofructokinase family hexose kinase n=1 Tax=Amycolatopsis sp. H20-H5 TaxID=3046309 RepID=UPI002DBC158E|nr:1-phosphofructokinase family hexose kinase [Amycolatopsis sp. H20-H5]MEC3977148.1 1-phosphofructokinase family hexose kinase [Amycolatopsis sp. H20-H5]